MTDNEKELIHVASRAHAALTAIYQWVDRVDKAGGTTCIAGVAEAHAMMKSMRANRKRLDALITEPLLSAIAKAESAENAD
jgi:hypothetical protein